MAEQAGMLMFQVKIPRFSVILLDDTAGVDKLRIPEEFAAEHGAKLPNTVVLKLPSGSEWKVKVLRRGREIWFDGGWQEFAQFNSIAPGHFMVFQYDSSGHFLVFIFDLTATEIDYKTRETEVNTTVELVRRVADEFENPGEANRTVDVPGENPNRTVELGRRVVDEFDVPLIELFPSLKTREKPPLRSPQPRKLIRRSEKGRSVRNSETVVYRGSSSSMAKQVRRTMSSDHSLEKSLKDKQAQKLKFGMEKTLTTAEKTRALARANAAFKTENPFFMLVMQPTYVSTKFRVSVPVNFFISNLKGKRGDIVLQVLDGRVWTVQYIVTNHSCQLRAYFGLESWAPFVLENSLKVGDVCAFELAKGSTKPRLKVVIFRDTQPCKRIRSEKRRLVSNFDTIVCRGSSSSMANQVKRTMTSDHSVRESLKDKQARKLTLTAAEKTRALAQANAAFKTENPFFMIAMQPSYICTMRGLSLPVSFFMRYLKGNSGDIVLQVPDGRVWTVEYTVVDHGSQLRAYFGFKSWAPFVRENSLKVGDVCAFELVKGGTEPKMNVVIFRASKDPHGIANRSNGMKTKKSSPSPGRIVHGRTRSLHIYGCSLGSTSGNASKRPKHSNKHDHLLSVESSSVWEAAKSFSSNRPFFKASVGASHLSMGQMRIPTMFNSHIKEVHDEAELWVADKCWGVRIRKVTTKTGRKSNFLGIGWGAFAAGNSLKVGDVCVYELMKSEADDDSRRTMVLSVHIFRGNLEGS